MDAYTTASQTVPPTGNLADKSTAQAAYARMESKRRVYLSRARRNALLTIPSLLPPEGFTSGSEIEDPYQAIGSRGVSNLASKLLFALLPPNVSFFRYEPSPAIQSQLDQQPDLKEQIEEGLASYEFETLREIERSRLRSVSYPVFKHLAVAGNCLLYVPNTGSVRYFPMTMYVCRRDTVGNLLEIYIKETVSPESLPGPVQEFIQSLNPTDTTVCEKDCDVYTAVVREDGRWYTWQEVYGHRIPDSDGEYPLDDPRYFALRWTRIDGEDYGRGFIEDVAGDLRVVDALSRAVAEGSLIMSKCLFGIKPAATVTAKDLEKKPNGGFFEGNPEDVWSLQVQKASDFQTAANKETDLRRSLSQAFLMNTSVQRDAERVTSEEIRFVAQELEDALGGMYSLMAEEFQRPLITRMMVRVVKNNPNFVQLPKGTVNPIIVTGIDALGRNHELQAFENVVAAANNLLTPQVVAQYLDVAGVLSFLFTNGGVKKAGLVKSADQVAQEQNQMQMAQAAQAAVPHLAKSVGDIASAHAAPPQQQPQQGA